MGARMRGLVALVVVVAALTLWPSTASASCPPWSSVATSKKDVNAGWAPDVGLKSYAVSVSSYLSRCHGKSFIDHYVYVNTSNFPWGYKFMFSIRTRRSDRVWRRVRKGGAGIFSFDGRKKIQELHLRQTRYTPGRTSITRVEVTHCACSLGSGAVPVWSTVGANFQSYRGPTVKPKSG